MTPEQFVFWLQGFVELTGYRPDTEQWESIKEHLAEVFKKVTPPGPGQLPKIPDPIYPNEPVYPIGPGKSWPKIDWTWVQDPSKPTLYC